MDWREKFRLLKVGDHVIIVKPHKQCKGGDAERCCKESGYMDSVCKIKGILNTHPKSWLYSISPKGCNFPRECLERVKK